MLRLNRTSVTAWIAVIVNTKRVGRLAAGCLAVLTILIAMIVSFPMNPSRAADSALAMRLSPTRPQRKV